MPLTDPLPTLDELGAIMRSAQAAIRVLNVIAHERDDAVSKLEPLLDALREYAIAETWFADATGDKWIVKGRHCLLCGAGVPSLTVPMTHDVACLLYGTKGDGE